MQHSAGAAVGQGLTTRCTCFPFSLQAEKSTAIQGHKGGKVKGNCLHFELKLDACLISNSHIILCFDVSDFFFGYLQFGSLCF